MARHQTLMICLNDFERNLLLEHTKKGNWSPREVIRAKILLLSDQNSLKPLMDEEIAQELGCSLSTVWYRRKRFAETKSIEDTIFDKTRSGRPTIIDGTIDAYMTTIACSAAPEGYAQWTLRLIRDRLVTLDVIDEISLSTVGRALKKRNQAMAK